MKLLPLVPLVLILLFHYNFAEQQAQCNKDPSETKPQTESCLLEKNTNEEDKNQSTPINTNYSMWIEPNFVDTQYSALLEGLEVTKPDLKDNSFDFIFWWVPYYVKAKVIGVYKGSLEKEQIIDLLVYLPAFSTKSQKKLMESRFILSFCKSNSGVYYTSRHFLILQPSRANISKFQDVRNFGTDYEGSGDCSGNYPYLNPDTYN